MGRYKLIQNYDNTVTGVKFYKDEVVEGTPNPTLAGFINVARGGKTASLVEKFDLVKVEDTTPLINATAEQVATATKSKSMASMASGVGFLAGLGYAFYTKRGFWGYVGFGLLGSIVASVGYNIVKKK